MIKTNKRILSLCLCLSFMFSMFGFAYALDFPLISVGTGSGEPGADVTVDLNIFNNLGFNSLNFSVDFDADMLTLGADIESDLEGTWQNTDGVLAFTATNAESDITANGTIATLTFTIAADAAPGEYDITLSNISGTDSASNPLEYNSDTGAVTVTAPPQPVKYKVTVAKSPSIAGYVYANKAEYSAGDTVTLTAENDEDYEFDYWSSSDGVVFADSDAIETTFTMPEKDVRVTANFKEIGKYVVDFTIEGGGTATCDKDEYIEGDTVRITAHPYTNYSFYDWNPKSKDIKLKTLSTYNASFEMPNHDVEIRVVFYPKSNNTQTPSGVNPGGSFSSTYSVMFDSVGGSAIAAYTVIGGQALGNPPSPPVKPGYIFDGWYTDIGYTNKYDFYSFVNGNIVLYAKWKSATETVTQPVAQPSAETGAFNDVKKSDWFYDEVTELFTKKIIGGVGDKQFKPNAIITRAQFSQILSNLAKAELSAYTSSSFGDIKATDWYMKPVEWAFENEITGGVGNDKFAPNAAITREDMAVMINRYATLVEKHTFTGDNTGAFVDTDSISEYAKSAVKAMSNAKIINGKPGNLFDPKANATRAEACKMIYELMKVLGK